MPQRVCSSLVSVKGLYIFTQAQLTMEQYFVRNLGPSDWERFDYCARRFVSLCIPPMADTVPRPDLHSGLLPTFRTSIHPDIFNILSRRGSPCLPNLRELSFFENDSLELRQASGLIGLCLRRLVFGQDYKKCEQDRIQDSIDASRVVFDQCSGLKALDLIPNDNEWPLFHTVSIMPVLPQLQHFSATHPRSERGLDTWRTFSHLIWWLSMQRSLKTLKVLLHRSRGEPGVLNHHLLSDHLKSISGRIFPALEELTTMLRDGLSELTKFISTLRNAKLRRINAVVGDFGDFGDLEALTEFHHFLETIPSFLDLSVLTHFKVHRFQGPIDRDEMGIGALSTLRMLFQARNLVHLDLWLSLSFDDMDSSFLEEMAAARPNLETMSILGAPRENGIGLVDVANFGCAHPRLVTLGLEFDANDVLNHESDTTTLVDRRNTTLRELRVGTSKITDAEAVASWLSLRFPNLSALLADDSYCHIELDDVQEETRIYHKWEEVFNLMFGHKSKQLQEHEEREAEVLKEIADYPARQQARRNQLDEEMRRMAAQLRQEFPRLTHDNPVG